MSSLVPPVRDSKPAALWSKPSRFVAKFGHLNIGFDGPALLVLALAGVVSIVIIVSIAMR